MLRREDPGERERGGQVASRAAKGREGREADGPPQVCPRFPAQGMLQSLVEAAIDPEAKVFPQ